MRSVGVAHATKPHSVPDSGVGIEQVDCSVALVIQHLKIVTSDI